jgi:Arc/MetJ-type ribon-helix-helix transcriptional regulator
MPKDTSTPLADGSKTYEERLEALRAALIQGEKSGQSEPFDFDEFLTRKRGQRPGRRITE